MQVGGVRVIARREDAGPPPDRGWKRPPPDVVPEVRAQVEDRVRDQAVRVVMVPVARRSGWTGRSRVRPLSPRRCRATKGPDLSAPLHSRNCGAQVGVPCGRRQFGRCNATAKPRIHAHLLKSSWDSAPRIDRNRRRRSLLRSTMLSDRFANSGSLQAL